MTQEQLEQAISNIQISELQRYNELKEIIKFLEKRYLMAVQDLDARVKILEEARQRQIAWNSSVTQKLTPVKEPEKPINKPRRSFWR